MIKLVYIIPTILATVVSLYYVFTPALVIGQSMYPTFTDGDVLITSRVFRKKRLKEGRVYVFKSKTGVYAIKRLTKFDPKYLSCYFEGDNPEDSYDSRDYGYIHCDNVIARVEFRLINKAKKGVDNVEEN